MWDCLDTDDTFIITITPEAEPDGPSVPEPRLSAALGARVAALREAGWEHLPVPFSAARPDGWPLCGQCAAEANYIRRHDSGSEYACWEHAEASLRPEADQ